MRRLGRLLGASKDSSFRLIVLVVDITLLFWLISSSPGHADAFRFVSPSIWETLRLTLSSFPLALILGLLTAIGVMSNSYILNSVANFYVRVVRGIPTLVILLYVGVVAVPMLSSLLGITSLGGFNRAVIALALASGPYHAEIIRGGFRAVDKGQFEAARSIGMRYVQAMRFVILPQVFRITLPSIANEFIIMLKDTALASALGIVELTRSGQLNVSRTRDTFSTWNVVTLLYLLLTVSMSFGTEVMRKRIGD